MSIVTNWHSFIEEAARIFPELCQEAALTLEGDIGALMRSVASAHDLTFAEAAEVVTFRLPQFLEAERLTA